LYDRVGSDPVAEVWHKNWTTAPKKALNPAGMPTSLDHPPIAMPADLITILRVRIIRGK